MGAICLALMDEKTEVRIAAALHVVLQVAAQAVRPKAILEELVWA